MWLHKDCKLSKQRLEGERLGITMAGSVSASYTPMLTDARYFGIDDGDIGEYRTVGSIECADCDETLVEYNFELELYKVEQALKQGDYENIEWKGAN